VTVARFRAFLADYDAWLAEGNPRDGMGRHHNIPDSGWRDDDMSWPYHESADTLTAAISGCNEGTPYRTFAPTGNDTLPMNCVDWYTAFLFCVWDGGRLPTEGEWEFAAVGGGYQLPYAWGTDTLDDSLSTASLAVYNCMGDGSEPGDCSPSDLLPVGSKVNGWFDHRDLNGSLAEWTLDFNSAYPTLEKVDYAFVFGGFQREIRGGSFLQAAMYQTSVIRDGQSADTPDENIGFRCARTPAP
jgi:formylglycine-generating enzyme required for sulfatase activity